MLEAIKRDLKKAANPKQASILQRFFKTGKGEYGDGDVFLGISVPTQRSVAQRYVSASRRAITALLASPIHEHRLTGALILVLQFRGATEITRTALYRFYIKNARRMNNWDLVDLTAPTFGEFLLDHDPTIIDHFASSHNLWERRIAVLFTFAFIRHNRYAETLHVAKLLFEDEHDLIHKAVGWMLREVGKRSLHAEEQFLKRHYRAMPRTMLRYAIERFPETKRKKYLEGLV